VRAQATRSAREHGGKSTTTIAESADRYRAGRRWRVHRLRAVAAAKNCSERRFFLAMTPNGPYSQAVIARGEEFFRRERAVNGDE